MGGGWACWLFGTVAMQLSWEFGTGLFRLDLFAVFDAFLIWTSAIGYRNKRKCSLPVYTCIENPVSGVLFCFKRSIEKRCAVVACACVFTVYLVNLCVWGWGACWLFGSVYMQLSWEFGTWFFGLDRISLQLLMLPEVSAPKNDTLYQWKCQDMNV